MTRTRFAPSPTGYMHVGNLRSALFAYLIAKHDNGEFILRIEDTDQNRYELNAENFIYKVMENFKLKYDEGPNVGGEHGPYIQSDRLNIYRKYAQYLLDNNYAYPCFCDEKELEKQRLEATSKNETFMYDGKCRDLTKDQIAEKINNGKKYVIRQKTPLDGTTSFHDEVYGDITIENKYIEDQILIKSDGYPTYNFCNVVDDGLMHITHVTRGNEYLSSTPKYLFLYDAFDFDRPKFIHLPHVIKKDGTKISKRNKDDNCMELLALGYLPEAIINYLALLGWSPKSNQEFFTLEELVKEFDIKNITKAPSCYDINKLRWFNSHYIKQMNDEEYLKFITPFIIKNCNMEGKSLDFVNHLCMLYKDQISYGAEIVELSKIFFDDNVNYDPKCREYLSTNPNVKSIVLTFREEISKISDWNITNINLAIENVRNACGVSGKDLYMPIRIAVSGTMHGVELTDTIYLIGKEKILNRLG